MGENQLGLRDGFERHEGHALRVAIFQVRAYGNRQSRHVLPMPPGPATVTNRTPGVSSRRETSSTSRSRPISDVGMLGNERGIRRSLPAVEVANESVPLSLVANRSLRSSARSLGPVARAHARYGRNR